MFITETIPQTGFPLFKFQQWVVFLTNKHMHWNLDPLCSSRKHNRSWHLLGCRIGENCWFWREPGIWELKSPPDRGNSLYSKLPLNTISGRKLCWTSKASTSFLWKSLFSSRRQTPHSQLHFYCLWHFLWKFSTPPGHLEALRRDIVFYPPRNLSCSDSKMPTFLKARFLQKMKQSHLWGFFLPSLWVSTVDLVPRHKPRLLFPNPLLLHCTCHWVVFLKRRTKVNLFPKCIFKQPEVLRSRSSWKMKSWIPRRRGKPCSL